MIERCRYPIEVDLHLPAEEIRDSGRPAAIGHVGELGAGQHHEQLADDMGGVADAGRRHVDRARVGLGIGDEFGDRLGRERRVDLHDERPAHQARDRSDVASETEVRLVVERGAERVRRRCKQQRIAVRRRIDDGFKADVAAGSRPVLDHNRLAEPLGQRLRQQAGDGVVRPAGGDADDETNGLGWIIERQRRWRDGANEGSRRGEAQDNAGYDSHASRTSAQTPPLSIVASGPGLRQSRAETVRGDRAAWSPHRLCGKGRGVAAPEPRGRQIRRTRPGTRPASH